MTLASKLSKWVDTTVGLLASRCVSTRIPWPVGNWKDVILPIDRDQSLCTFSAVIRSWTEYAGGGIAGLRLARGKPHSSSLAPCEMSNWALTISVIHMLSVMVCSTWRRGFTSRK
jgi:hypothetical protein